LPNDPCSPSTLVYSVLPADITALGRLIVTSHDSSNSATGRFDDIALGPTGAYELRP